MLCKLTELIDTLRLRSRTLAISEHGVSTSECFIDSVDALTNVLVDDARSRWLLVHENAYIFAIGFFALIRAQKHIVLPPSSQHGAVNHCLSDVDAVLAEPSLCSGVESAGVSFVVLDHDQSQLRHSPCSSSNVEKIESFASSTVTLLTSGSTGDSKRITKKIEQLDAEIACLESMWGEDIGDSIFFSTVSHQHIYGLLFRLLWPLCSGRAFFAESHVYPEMLVGDIKSSAAKGAVVVSSPAHLGRWPEALDVSAIKDAVAKLFNSGGALSRASALQLLKSFGQAPVEVLGSSETGGVATRFHERDKEEPWTLLPNVEGRVDKVSGVLSVRSPQAGGDAWVEMGDRVSFINDRQFMLSGRADSIIKVEGKRLSLDALNRQLTDLSWVKEAKSLVLENNRQQVAVVVAIEDEALTLLKTLGKRHLNSLIIDFLSQYIDRVLLPKKFRYVDRMPVNSQGKTVLAELQALFLDYIYENSVPVSLVYMSGDAIFLSLNLPVESEVFDGHFPGMPILAGVQQVGLVMSQVHRFFYPGCAVKRIDRLKFKAVMQPMRGLQLRLKRLANECVSFEYHYAGALLASGRVQLKLDANV